MCDTALCNAMALCEHCFDAKFEEGATQVASPPKKQKKSCLLNLSPEDKRLHDNKLKANHTRRKKAKVKADKDLLVSTQAECARLKQEKDELLQKHRKEMAVLREAGAHAIRSMEEIYGKVGLLVFCIYSYNIAFP